MMMDDGDVGDNWSYKTWKASAANVSILDFIGAKDDGDGGDNWSYKTCKAPVDKPTPVALGQLTRQASALTRERGHASSRIVTNTQTFYRLFALPVAQPTISEH